MKRVRTTAEAVELGHELLAAKQRLGHGHFLGYLKGSDIGEDTARRWMLIAQQVDQLPELLDLKLSMAYRVVTTSVEREVITASIVAVKRQWRERDIEEAIVKHLQAQGIPAERQVTCPAGKIDIVTPDALYEVELFLSRDVFFHALGQVLLYRQSFDPMRRAIIAGLLDPGSDITDLVAYARPLDVDVEFWSVPVAADYQPATTALDVLREVAATLADLVGLAKTLPAGEETERALEQAERALAAIRRAVRQH
jgi:hypothetical protein